MGCHTWTYKKYNACSQEQKDKFLKECNDTLKFCLEPYKEYKKSMKACAKEYMQYAKKGSNEYNEWAKYLEEDVLKSTWEERYKKYERFKDCGLSDDNVLDFCNELSESASYNIVNDTLYIEVDFDYPFRVYGYLEETFTDKNELLTWLKEKDPCWYGYYDQEKKEFVEGYTDELVNQIDMYFKENGENNLYFEFG